MLRFLAVVLIFAVPVGEVSAGTPARIAPRPLASALEAVHADRWDVAARLAARDGPAAADLVEWHRLRAGRGEPAEILDFLDRNGHWPGLAHLRLQSESAMTRADDDAVLDFYDRYTPQTGTGALDAARARLARGRRGAAEAGLVMAWLTLDLTEAEHAEILGTFGALLAPHHDARLDMALWRGLADDVERMLPLASESARRRAETRIRVAEAGPEGLDAAQRRDPGIAFALFEFHLARSGDAARTVLLRQSRISGGLGVPDRWAGWRRVLARRAMRNGEAARAYEIAALHQLSDKGAHYADLEWLAGYIALRYLDSPGLARDHFQRLRAAVRTPISRGRAGYWLGRALEASGDIDSARLAYAGGAEYPTSFYGLLAAERAGIDVAERLSAATLAAPWRAAAFADSDLHEIGTLALRLGDDRLALRFFGRLAAMQDRQGIARMGAMLDEIGTPWLQVRIGKAAAQRGLAVIAPYYALHPMTALELPTPMHWALAIARRESEFRPDVISGTGARGLMQLMPATARAMARKTGLPWERDRLNTDWQYNVRLGAAYLAQLDARYDGNPLLMAAAYNAGPGRLADWLDRYGDPRLMDAEAVMDWIEHLPFSETRNYVMRVAESLPVYRARLGRAALPQPFSGEISGRGTPVTE